MMKILNKIASSVVILTFSSLSLAGTLTPADANIVAKIHAKFSSDNSISAKNISVTSHHGEVELTGRVDTSSEANKLVELAESVDQVKDVDSNHLTVLKSEHAMQDALLTAKVKGTFVREKLFGNTDVAAWGAKVETKNQIVYLTGDVANQAEIDNAIKLAKSVKGVKNVKSKLQIKAQ